MHITIADFKKLTLHKTLFLVKVTIVNVHDQSTKVETLFTLLISYFRESTITTVLIYSL